MVSDVLNVLVPSGCAAVLDKGLHLRPHSLLPALGVCAGQLATIAGVGAERGVRVVRAARVLYGNGTRAPRRRCFLRFFTLFCSRDVIPQLPTAGNCGPPTGVSTGSAS